MTISVCMMVRNEEALLRRALGSTAGLADEVVVVDTGSTDGTVALARELGARVITGGDRRHKGEARNLGLRAAQGDWCVVLDADETIAKPAEFRALLDRVDDDAVYVKETYIDEGGQPTLSFNQMRAFRRDMYEYRYRAHELPLPVNGVWGKVNFTDFCWEHRPPKDRTWKREHMLMLLLMDVDENPGDPRPLYYLAREYMYIGAWQACIEKTRECMALANGNLSDAAEAWGNLATCYKNLGNQEMTRQCLHQALSSEPDRRDWYGWLAELYHEEKKHEQAAGLLYTAIHLSKPLVGYADERWYGPHIYDLLARCLYYAGRKDEGRPFAEKAVELAPGNERLRANLRWFDNGHH